MLTHKRQVFTALATDLSREECCRMFGGQILPRGSPMKLCHAVSVLALAASLVVVSGCSSSTAKSVSEAPTANPTPIVSSSPSEQELHQQAVEIFKKVQAETETIERAGGADQLPASLNEYVTGYLAETLTTQYQQWKEQRLVLTGRGDAIEWTKPYPTQREGSVVAIAVCSDGTQAEVSRAGTPVTEGSVAINCYFYKYFDGTLKAFTVAYREVGRCSDY